MAQHSSVTNAMEAHRQRWKMVERSFRGNFSNWSTTFDSPLSPFALSRTNGKNHRMVSQMVTIVRASWHDIKIDRQLTILLFAFRTIGVYASLVHSPSISPLLVSSSPRVFSCVLSCVRHVLTGLCFWILVCKGFPPFGSMWVEGTALTVRYGRM